jgi:hypothetical protein
MEKLTPARLQNLTFIITALLPVFVAGCAASQAELNERAKYLAAAQDVVTVSAAAKGDKKALQTVCWNYYSAAYLKLSIDDADQALRACDTSARAGNGHSAYIMGLMLETTQGYYRQTPYASQFATHLQRNIATAQWFRLAEKNGEVRGAAKAREMEEWIAKSSGSGSSDLLGKAAVGLFVAGVAGTSNISSEAKTKVMTSLASDLASDGKGTATANLLAEQNRQAVTPTRSSVPTAAAPAARPASSTRAATTTKVPEPDLSAVQGEFQLEPILCLGTYYAVGDLPVKNGVSCYDMTYEAVCPNGQTTPGFIRNFRAGKRSSCSNMEYAAHIYPKPNCPVSQVQVRVTSVKPGCK